MTSQPPLAPVRVEFLAAWLRENRSNLGDEACRIRLIEAGHDPRDVDVALELARSPRRDVQLATGGDAQGSARDSPGDQDTAVAIAVTARPGSLILAVVALLFEGAGAIALAIVRWPDALGSVAFIGVMAVGVLLAFGSVSMIAGIGTWAGVGIAAVLGTLVQVVVLIFAAAAWSSGAWLPALGAAGLGISGLGGLVAPSTRRALRT